MYQNQWEYGSTLNWVKGKHTISFGAQWDHTQLNIINNNTSDDTIDFKTFVNFVEGAVRTGTYSAAFSGSADRYYRSDTVGAFVNDNYKVRSNLTVTMGLRWDNDGALSEKYGRLTGFDNSLYSYNAATDTITGSGLEFAGNNAAVRDQRRQQHSHDAAPMDFRAAPRRRLDTAQETHRARRLWPLCRSRRIFLLPFAQRGRRL